MMPTIMIAAPMGVRVGHELSETWLRQIYTVLLFVIAIDLIRKLAILESPVVAQLGPLACATTSSRRSCVMVSRR